MRVRQVSGRSFHRHAGREAIVTARGGVSRARHSSDVRSNRTTCALRSAPPHRLPIGLPASGLRSATTPIAARASRARGAPNGHIRWAANQVSRTSHSTRNPNARERAGAIRATGPRMAATEKRPWPCVYHARAAARPSIRRARAIFRASDALRALHDGALARRVG
jgi:hypothetical protein